MEKVSSTSERRANVSTSNERSRWREAYATSPAAGSHATTQSGIDLDPVYGPPDAEYPGLFPYTRGIHPAMYRSRLWTMRMFAGFGTARDQRAIPRDHRRGRHRHLHGLRHADPARPRL